MRSLVPALAAFSLLSGCGSSAASEPQAPAELFDEHRGAPLERFASAEAFDRYIAETLRAARRRGVSDGNSIDTATFDVEAPPPPADMEAPLYNLEAGGAPANPSITNNQTIGVDEGGIVKQVGRFLVILQDGRLFSADLGTGEGAPLRLADRMDVYRSRESAADWYDEMLVHGDRILVTAYNYGERASEITVARIAPGGRLTREGRFLISSNDYYSTENYSSRLVGDSLVFYAPVSLHFGENAEGPAVLPTLRRASGDAEPGRPQALLRPTDIYAPPGRIDSPTLHAVSICPLRGGDLECRTSAFIGGFGREIYVSPTDAFLWVEAPDGMPWEIDYANRRRTRCQGLEAPMDPAENAAMVYRIPLDGSAVGAVAVEGFPVDQFAFDSRDGRFRALLRRPGDDPCTYDLDRRPLALLDLPLAAFGESVRRVADSAYRPLPAIDGDQLENRFLGDWLLYGGRTTPGRAPAAGPARPEASVLVAVPLADPAAPLRLRLPHDVLRIERAGGDAVVTGYGRGDGLSLSYIGLGTGARLAGTGFIPGRYESEGRSHAFNAWMRADGSGLIGLPTSRRNARADRDWSDSEASELSYVTVAPGGSMAPAGELKAGPRRGAGRYQCQVSCIDWYGNSRPIFTGGRIFALMGTDLVEGRMQGGRIAEAGRVDLTAPPLALAR